MGVYIDMDMPKSCLECRLYNDPWCMAKNRNQWKTAYNRPLKGERQNDCPLVPVPPHGDLIDRDAVRGTIKPLSPEDGRNCCTFDTVKKLMNTMLDRAPIIVPAEERET